jgi:hypothetical protein
MARSKGKSSATLIDKVLGESSWLLSHAQALSDYGRSEEAAAEWARAAGFEEQAACLLEAAGQEHEAAIHRVSAASCSERIGQHAHAVTLLHAALSVPLPEEYRERVERQLAQALVKADKELRQVFARRAHKQAPALS